jgi:hypothetical protein
MKNEKEVTTARHIRPNVRKPRTATAAPSKNTSMSHEPKVFTAITDDDAVEQTRKRMESWMGLGKSKEMPPSSVVATETATKALPPSPKTEIISKAKFVTPTQPVGILKTPKYSKPKSDVSPSDSNPVSTSPPPISSKPVVCKDLVVERDPTRPIPKLKPFRQPKPAATIDDILLANSGDGSRNTDLQQKSSIEGYTPSLSFVGASSSGGNNGDSSMVRFNNPLEPSANSPMEKATHTNDMVTDTSSDDNEPLYLNTLADLMEAAGETLPDASTPITSDTKMVEANIEFSVMTQEEYDSKLSTLQQERDEDRKDQMKMFMGKLDIFGDGSDNDDDDMNENDDDAMMELLMGGASNDDEDHIHYDHNDDSDNRPEQKPRAFLLLWDALSTWMTPQTVDWVKALEDTSGSSGLFNQNEWTPMVDRSHIGSSRCAGVMAMLKLYLSGCMEELQYPLDERRKAEKRLTDLLRTFDYSRENPKLHVSHWKAMTCVLLEMVMKVTNENHVHQVPPSVADLDMSLEEYQYLTQKTITTFIPKSPSS